MKCVEQMLSGNARHSALHNANNSSRGRLLLFSALLMTFSLALAMVIQGQGSAHDPGTSRRGTPAAGDSNRRIERGPNGLFQQRSYEIPGN